MTECKLKVVPIQVQVCLDIVRGILPEVQARPSQRLQSIDIDLQWKTIQAIRRNTAVGNVNNIC
jgi:hypothetical protein